MKEKNKYSKPFSHPRWHEILVPTVVGDVENPSPELLEQRRKDAEMVEKMIKKWNLPKRPANEDE